MNDITEIVDVEGLGYDGEECSTIQLLAMFFRSGGQDDAGFEYVVPAFLLQVVDQLESALSWHHQVQHDGFERFGCDLHHGHQPVLSLNDFVATAVEQRDQQGADGKVILCDQDAPASFTLPGIVLD